MPYHSRRVMEIKSVLSVELVSAIYTLNRKTGGLDVTLTLHRSGSRAQPMVW